MTGEIEQSASHKAVSMNPRDNLRYDVPASIVVFLIALPLCLGIAFASGAPIFAGLVSGIVGGLVVAPISRAPLAVTGPAAGLVVIVLTAIADLGYEGCLAAVVVAGVFQIILGYLRAGIIGYYFPSSVIKGMLAGIGAVLVLKQLPHAFGFDRDFEGDDAFLQSDGHNSLTEIYYAVTNAHVGATLIAVIGVLLLVAWGRVPALKRLRFLPGPLAVVVVGVALNVVFEMMPGGLSVREHLLVGIPVPQSLAEFSEQMRRPELDRVLELDVLKTAAILAVVASIETLLSLEAVDKLDPFKRVTPASHELKAQGVGNVVAGLLGGLPLTAVIVRGSANAQSGARTKMSAIIHGALLLGTVAAVPGLLNQIPLAALAAILLHVGYKLASIDKFRAMWAEGRTQFLPFAVTCLAIVFTDLLTGIAVGMAIGLFFVLRQHVSAPYAVHEVSTFNDDGQEHTRVELSDNVSFLNKPAIMRYLAKFTKGSIVEIDARRCHHIDHDVLEEIDEFIEAAPRRGIEVIAHGLDAHRRNGSEAA